jgi:putative ABC transport system ATP-binding protein
VRRSIGLSGQYAAVDEYLTGRENLVMFGRLSGMSKSDARARADELLHQFDLADAADRVSKGYSGGMRRRLDLASSLMARPPILFLDEPTTGLHFEDVSKLLGVLNRLVDTGNTVVVIEHNLDVIKCSDWVIDMGPEGGFRGGLVVAEGTPAEVEANPKSLTGAYLAGREAIEVPQKRIPVNDRFLEIIGARGNNLQSVHAKIPVGLLTCVTGVSGSGKSTLLHILAGIDTATRGTVEVQGVNVAGLNESELADWRNQNVGFVFQSFNLIPVLTAFENVELPLLLTALSKAERRRQVETSLELVGLADRGHHRPDQMSGGQQQRVAIARAIATDPTLIIADEPTGNLDSKSASDVLGILQSLARDAGKTVVMVTHDPKAASYGTRSLHLEKGEFVA